MLKVAIAFVFLLSFQCFANSSKYITALQFEEACNQSGSTTFTAHRARYALQLGPQGSLKIQPTGSIAAEPLVLQFIGANKDAVPQGANALLNRINIIRGPSPANWCLDRPTFATITYQELYSGIDVGFHAADDGLFEFDLILKAGANPGAIRLRAGPGKRFKLNRAGTVELSGYGGARVLLQKPHTFQMDRGIRRNVTAHYRITEAGEVTFRLGKYNSSLPLAIDPVVTYSTYLGGAGFDAINASTVDSSGSVYVAGETFSTAFNSGSGSRSNKDLFITKLNSSGTSAVFTTIIGGSDADSAKAIAVDTSGNIFVTGNTLSRDFPATAGAFQTVPTGQPNAFVLKLNPAGALIYASYLGAPGASFGTGIALDSSGNAYVTGYTSSVTFPTTPGAQQQVFAGGFYDAFVSKLDPSGSTLLYSTLLGGLGTDTGHGIAVDRSGYAYVVGQTDSSNFPLQSPLQAAPGGQSDAFVAKIDPNGKLVYSTYLGGSNSDSGTAIAVDSGSSVYVTGVTASENFPVSSGAFQSLNNGLYDAFVAQLNPAGSALVYSTYIGGTGLDIPTAIVTDGGGNAWICGYTNSFDFPLQKPTQATHHGAYDAFVLALDAVGAQLRYSSFLGGSGDDRAYGIGVTGTSAYVAGFTSSTDFPIAGGPVQAIYNGNTDGFVTRLLIDFPLVSALAAPSVSPAKGSGSSQSFTFTYTDPAGFQDISGSQILINSTSSGAFGCYIFFGRGGNAIALADDAGTAGPLTTLGAPTVLQNSQCSVLASISSQTSSGNSVVLSVYVVFKSGFAGPKNVFSAFSTNSGVSSGFQNIGTFTATVSTQSLSAVSVSSASSSGSAQSFTFNYFDPNGYSDISGSQVLFSPNYTAVGACYVLFGRGTNQIGLADDTGSNFTLAPLGGQTVLQNSQCSVFAANSFQSGSGTNLFLTLFVAFKPAFAGPRNIYSGITDNGGARSIFAKLADYTVPAAPPPLAVNSVTPSTATGPSNPLTFVFSDPNGFVDISGAQVVVNPTLTNGPGSCYIQFAPSGSLTLLGNDGVSTTTANLGQPAVLQNSQCIVNAAASYQAGNGSYLSLTLFVTMKTPGTKNVYATVSSNGGTTSVASQVGTWNVTSPSALMPVSVSPGTGAGAAGTPQFFTLTYSDPLGANDISGSQIIINPALQGAFACYVLYGRGSNLLAIANDNATAFTNGTLGTAGTLQSSQCSVDLSKSFQVQTGNTVNLTLAVTFAPGYRGLMYVFSNVVNNAGNASSFPALGAYLIQ